jgi:S1-C subfamily serine protease
VVTDPPPKEERGPSSGSGVFITRSGHILTNDHVVESCSSITVRPDGGTPIAGTVLARDARNDLAVVKVSGPVNWIVPVRSGVRLGEGIAAFGFPHTDMLASSGNFTLGNVTALAGMGDDTRYLQISAPVQAGNSGGPLIDGYGNLVGVVSAKLNALKVMAASGDLPQNVNFAIKASLAASFLDANQVTYDSGATSGEKLDAPDLAERAKQASVFITCHR